MADSADFDAMEATFRETARGRWFLDEVARRARLTETDVLLDALRRIERAVDPAPIGTPPSPSPRRSGVEDGPTLAILEAAELIQETAWTMREAGAEPGWCDRLDGAATEIYAACALLSARGGTGPAASDDPAAADLPPSPAIRDGADDPPGGAVPAPAGMALADLARSLRRDDPAEAGANERLRLFT